MNTLPRRTTPRDRRLVLIVLVIATALSALTLLAMDMEYGPVLLFPAAALAITAGSLAARRARVTLGRAFLAERVILSPIIWLGLIARTLSSMSLPFGGGNSAADLGVWFLGGTWAWGGLGAAAFGVKRLYEREAALERLARRRSARPAVRWPMLLLTSAVAIAMVAPLLAIHAEPALIVAAALLAAVGALLVGLGFPGGVRSPLGRGLLLGGLFALAASVAPFATYLASPFVSRAAEDPWAPKREIGQWLGLAASYALIGAWMLARPFADHEWRLGLRHARGSR